MQTFANGDSMKASNLCNSLQIRREIASDLVLHEENREKQGFITLSWWSNDFRKNQNPKILKNNQG